MPPPRGLIPLPQPPPEYRHRRHRAVSYREVRDNREIRDNILQPAMIPVRSAPTLPPPNIVIPRPRLSIGHPQRQRAVHVAPPRLSEREREYGDIYVPRHPTQGIRAPVVYMYVR